MVSKSMIENTTTCVAKSKFDNVYGNILPAGILPATDAMVDETRALKSYYVDVDKSCAFALC
eukprot:13751216-Heterocapsa_arctica.AAC.1